MYTMLETPHVAVGAAIVAKVTNPYLAIPLAFLSHFVLDKVPHWNPHTYTETMKLGTPSKKTMNLALLDIGVALALGLGLAYTRLPDINSAVLIIVGSFAATVVDISKYPFFLWKETRKGLYKKWVDFERSLQEDTGFIPGVLTQLTIIIASVWWFFN